MHRGLQNAVCWATLFCSLLFVRARPEGEAVYDQFAAPCTMGPKQVSKFRLCVRQPMISVFLAGRLCSQLIPRACCCCSRSIAQESGRESAT
mmetsp:Transcript_44346/g.80348  ORF Transcript_44346/g.80348 Transcript_44346/m.80348 type:complete len:92 (-) Transcript_44346:385-660(-)